MSSPSLPPLPLAPPPCRCATCGTPSAPSPTGCVTSCATAASQVCTGATGLWVPHFLELLFVLLGASVLARMPVARLKHSCCLRASCQLLSAQPAAAARALPCPLLLFSAHHPLPSPLHTCLALLSVRSGTSLCAAAVVRAQPSRKTRVAPLPPATNMH